MNIMHQIFINELSQIWCYKDNVITHKWSKYFPQFGKVLYLSHYQMRNIIRFIEQVPNEGFLNLLSNRTLYQFVYFRVSNFFAFMAVLVHMDAKQFVLLLLLIHTSVSLAWKINVWTFVGLETQSECLGHSICAF